MGREVKRVPLGFTAPSDRTWEGYVMPDRLEGETCMACAGRGDSPEAKHLYDLWYGNIPFRPEDNDSKPLSSETPAVRAFGWAPSLVGGIVPGLVVDGVTATTN